MDRRYIRVTVGGLIYCHTSVVMTIGKRVTCTSGKHYKVTSDDGSMIVIRNDNNEPHHFGRYPDDEYTSRQWFTFPRENELKPKKHVKTFSL